MITVNNVLTKADRMADVLTELGCENVKVYSQITAPEDRNVVWVSIECSNKFGHPMQAFSATGYTSDVFKALENFRMGVVFAAANLKGGE